MTVLDTVDVDPDADTRPDPGPDRSANAVRILTALVGLAAVVAAVLGVLWLVAANDDSIELASTRDAVLVDARQAAINLNSLDYQAVEPGLDLWEQSSTGGLLDEFRANRAEYAGLVTESRRTTAASIADAAVAELDVRAGVARVVVGVDVQVTVADQEPTLFRQRLQIEMTRTEQGWKASKADIVR